MNKFPNSPEMVMKVYQTSYKQIFMKALKSNPIDLFIKYNFQMCLICFFVVFGGVLGGVWRYFWGVFGVFGRYCCGILAGF